MGEYKKHKAVTSTLEYITTEYSENIFNLSEWKLANKHVCIYVCVISEIAGDLSDDPVPICKVFSTRASSVVWMTRIYWDKC